MAHTIHIRPPLMAKALLPPCVYHVACEKHDCLNPQIQAHYYTSLTQKCIAMQRESASALAPYMISLSKPVWSIPMFSPGSQATVFLLGHLK